MGWISTAPSLPFPSCRPPVCCTGPSRATSENSSCSWTDACRAPSLQAQGAGSVRFCPGLQLLLTRSSPALGAPSKCPIPRPGQGQEGGHPRSPWGLFPSLWTFTSHWPRGRERLSSPLQKRRFRLSDLLGAHGRGAGEGPNVDSAFWTASGPACSLFVHQTEPLEGEERSLLGPASPAQAPARKRVLDGRSLPWSASHCGQRVQGRQTVHRQAEHLLCAVAGAQRSQAPGAMAPEGQVHTQASPQDQSRVQGSPTISSTEVLL